MKEFRTELTPKKSASPIGLKDKTFTIGSCFSDEMGELLEENKFSVCSPFGAVYNPVSIHQLLCFGLHNEVPSGETYSQNGDVHFNYHFHSSFSALRRSDLEDKVRESIKESNDFLKNVSRIIITYGTAFVYRLKTTNEIVANCHKMPSVNFEKQLLTESDITESFEKFYLTLKSINAFAKIILTVSPVRHLKDTLELNAVSKSILRTACHSIVSKFPEVEYFPAYEILLDDLRDYRFYKTDQLHPSEEAVEYIWEKFADAHFDEGVRRFISEWKKIKNDLAHRPFQPESESHQKFVRSLLLRLENLKSTVDVSKEISDLKLQIRVKN